MVKSLVKKLVLPLVVAGSLALGGCQNKYEKVAELINVKADHTFLTSNGGTGKDFYFLNDSTEFFLTNYSEKNAHILDIVVWNKNGFNEGFFDYGANGMGDSLDVYVRFDGDGSSEDSVLMIKGEGTKMMAKRYDSIIVSIPEQYKNFEKENKKFKEENEKFDK